MKKLLFLIMFMAGIIVSQFCHAATAIQVYDGNAANFFSAYNQMVSRLNKLSSYNAAPYLDGEQVKIIKKNENYDMYSSRFIAEDFNMYIYLYQNKNGSLSRILLKESGLDFKNVEKNQNVFSIIRQVIGIDEEESRAHINQQSNMYEQIGEERNTLSKVWCKSKKRYVIIKTKLDTKNYEMYKMYEASID